MFILTCSDIPICVSEDIIKLEKEKDFLLAKDAIDAQCIIESKDNVIFYFDHEGVSHKNIYEIDEIRVL